MAEAERLNTNCDCFLIVVPSIRTHDGGGVKFDIQTTEHAYKIIKRDSILFKVHLEKALEQECKVTLINFDLKYEGDLHMISTCRFATIDEQKRFVTFVDEGKLAQMLTKYAENTAMALEMGYEISTNFKVVFRVSNVMRQIRNQEENEKSQTLSHITTKAENMEKLQISEIKNNNSDMKKLRQTPTEEDKNKSKVLIRLYVHTETKNVKNVSLHCNGGVSHMNNLDHTKLWETYVFVSTSEKKMQFSIEANYRTSDSLSVTEHLPINKPQIFSITSSVSYVFLLMPKVSSHISIFRKAMFENLCYIVNTVAEKNINESILQLEAVMRECGLPENVGLHVKCKNWDIEEAKFILQDLAINDNNAVLYCYLVYLIITDLSVLYSGKIVDVKSAQTILNTCSRISRRNVPIHCLKSAACVMQYLCKLVYKDEASILLLLHISYSLFGDEVFLAIVESNLKEGNKVLELFKPTSQFECSDLLEGLYNSALVDKHSCQLVQLIFRHLHINQLLDFMQKMKKKNLHGGLYNSIEEKLSYEIMRVMTVSGKRGELKEVLQFWKKAYALGVNCPKVILDYTQNAIVTALAVEEKMVRFTDVDLLYGVLKEDNLFKSSSIQFQLLKLLSRSKNTDLQQLFFDLLNQTKHMTLDEDQMWQIIYPCFANILLKFKNKQGYGKDKILKYYFHYSHIISTSYVQKHCTIQQKLEDVILGEMQKCKLRHMILAIPDIEAAQCSADIFQKHINTILLQCCAMDPLNKITNDICGSLPLMVDTRTILSVIQTILTTVEIADEEPDETIFKKITDSSKFWICILTSKGKMVDEIKQHIKVKTIETTIRNTIHGINKQSINSKFLLLLMNRVEESKSILHCMADETGNLSEKLSKCQKEISDYQLELRLVDNTLRQLKRIPNKRLQSILRKSIELVKECEDDLSQGRIIADELSAGTFSTQIVQDIAELCKHLENVVLTRVFQNLTQQFLENKEAELKQFKNCRGHGAHEEVSLFFLFDEPKADGNDFNRFSLKSAKKVIEVIAKDCVGRYKKWWNNFDLGIDHTLTDLGTILMGVEDMVTEIRKAENTCIFEFEDHIRNGLIQFSKLSSYRQTVDTIKIAAKAFKFDNQNSIYFDTVHQFEILLNENLSNVTLKEIIPLLQKIDRVDIIISEDIQNILRAIKKSSALLEFLQEVVDDDLRNLIDAVEEHSEQYVRESTVSDLIEIKRFLHPILKGSFLEKMDEFFELLQKQIDNAGNNSISGKILICGDNLHSLKALYRNVANRGERTVEVIENIMQKGTFHFSLKSTRTCEVAVQYAQDEKEYTHSSADLSDLRSRALLLMNAEDKDQNNPKSIRKEQLEKFVHSVDEALEIAALCLQLKQAGHFSFARYEDICRRENMKKLKLHLQHQYEEWKSEIQSCRLKYYYLNFLYSDQLYQLYYFLREDKRNDIVVTAILRFIDPSMDDLEHMTAIYNNLSTSANSNNIHVLENIGKTLDKLYSGLHTTSLNFLECRGHTKITDKVQPGIPYITSLAKESPLVIRTLLALYLNTTGLFPQANQVLFCRRDTTFEEISLLLNRCMHEKCPEYSMRSLYSIANIEMLQPQIQFDLHNEIRRLPKEEGFLLCLTCRGHENHPFLDQFSDMLSRPSPLTELVLKQFMGDHWSHVTVVTSDVPGLGKSEFIQRKAIHVKKRSVCVHISGPFNRLSIIEDIIRLRPKKYHVLHLDIGVVSDPAELDLFLFEMIVLRHISAGSTAYALSYGNIFIEIANTINDELNNSLPTIKCFKREHLQWMGYKNLRVSSEINSPIQVVCHYLKSLDEGLVDTRDLYFTGTKALDPLDKTECGKILERHFQSSGDMSFTIMNVFINVLADQLKKLSSSVFFRTPNLMSMLKENESPTVKSSLIKALEHISKDFASRSVNACRSAQLESVIGKSSDSSADILAERTAGMIRWEDSNHLVVLFHQNVQTVSALYRNVQDVPQSVKNLFESQVKNKLVDFKEKSSDELKTQLLMLTRRSPIRMDTTSLQNVMSNYVLTPDNLLKMVLILLRVNSKVPVLIMGETGCGKTSLISFLAKICGVNFDVFGIHAGIDDSDITKKFNEVNQNALKNISGKFWLFLDEINTCNHLGLIADALCHRMLFGKDLAPNLTLLAACNPYRLREAKEILTTGLQGKIKQDELSRLVYRVHPLPEALIDYVWDYGSLSEDDEVLYIFKMVENVFSETTLTRLLADVLVISQRFVRTVENNDYCVSLRDIDRCRKLVQWFDKFLLKKNHINSDRDRKVRAIILGLAICYHSRFPEGNKRQKYRQEVQRCICSTLSYKITEDDILNHILTEQKDILNLMTELPPGTALNAALQENVFMLLVCILNKIPIFLVGKPGCSKSLSMQLIRSNLRGKDSSTPLFQDMPQLFCVSFQGSESSTSNGIIKVFEKAEKYQFHNDERDVLSVVILDEIGLAEISKFNPLKVLHGLIERHDEQLKVAVVGISNWALDAAKMNRAIHLSRPDMDLNDLIYTGKSISESMIPSHEVGAFSLYTKHTIDQQTDRTELLEGIAKAYNEYYLHELKFPNFHGLRDFYSLIKYLGRNLDISENTDSNEVCEVILTGILRNFGGLTTEKNKILEIFRKYIPGFTSKEIPVMKLIVENIRDNACRHLMLITNGDAVISILENQLNELGMPFDIIFGSRFEYDLTDAYNYRILSRIILCMEQGMVLILKDLESIYGSLYDMLNQNYTVVGKKKHCRVALGHYSNPMCQVHDNFKCVVLVEESKLDYSDPPFLNRFEKQQVTFSDFLDKESLKKAVDELDKEMIDFCKIPDHSFSPYDLIPSYSQNLLISLIIRSQQLTKCTASIETVKKLALNTLLWLIPPEVIIRSTESEFSKSKTPAQINQIINKYMQLPIHNGLCHYFDTLHFESTDMVEKTAKADDILKEETDSTDAADVKYLDIAQCTLIETQMPDNTILDETKLTEDDTSIEKENFTNSFKEQTLQEVLEENAQLNLFADKEMASGYDSNERKGKLDSCVYLNVVNTFSGINALIDTSSQWRKLQREKLAIFRSEKQFSLTVEEFFKSDNNIFLLHCISSTESQHLLLVKGIIEKHIRTQKIDLCKEGKYICIVVHLERNGSKDIPLTFLSGWRLLFIDSIRKPRTFLEQFRRIDQVQIVSERIPLDDYIRNMILWAFSRIKFTSKQISVQTIEDLMTRMKSSSEMITTTEAYIISWITKRSFDMNVFETGGYDLQNFGSSSWCIDVAKNPYELLKAGSFIDALELSIQEIIRHPLTLFIFKLVEQNLLNPIFVEDALTSERRLIWKRMVLSENYLSTDDIPPPSGPECYLCSSEPLNLYMPCSQLLMMQIDSRKNEYLEIIGRLRIDNSIDPDEEMPKDLFEYATTSCIDFICHEAIFISEEFTYTDRNKDFIRDFCNFNSFAILSEKNELQRINIFKWALSNFIDLGKLEDADFLCLVSNMHAGLWVYGQVIHAICEMVNLLIRSIDISILPIPAMNWFKELGNEASYFVTQNEKIQRDDEHLSISCNDRSGLKEYELAILNSVSTHDVESSDMSDLFGTANNSYTGTDNNPSRNNENDIIVCRQDTKMQPGCDMIQYKSSSMSREQLVKHVCLSLLPTREVLKDLDINEWLCLLRNVLPLAHIVHDDSCELTALKFCQDLADVSVVNEHIPVTDINDLGHCILECNGNLDSTNVCECLYRILRKLKFKTSLEADKFQKLFCSYILRCLISAPGNTEPLKFVLREITRKTFLDQTLSYFGQVVKFAVIIDLSENMDIYINMLKDVDSLENEENFSFCFDYYLTNLEITKTDNLSLPVLLLDALEHYAFDEHLTIENMKSIDSSSDKILQCLSQSCQIMETVAFSLKFIVALAFIRKFMALFVDLLESTKYNCCTFPILSQHINSAMDVSTKSGYRELLSSEILHLFMKHIDQRMGHQHIQKICRRVEPYIPVFENIQWETKYVEKSSVFNPLFLHLDKECYNLFLTHINCVGHKNNKLNDLLLERNGIWYFVCVLAQSYFMSKCLGERNDSEIQVAEEISNLVQKLQITEELKNIINKMLGMMNFKHNFFNLSVMVESPQSQIISVMIHLACIVGNRASHDNFWYQLIMKPLSLALCNVPYTMFINMQEKEFSVIRNVSGNILQFLLHGSLVLSLELETISLEAVKNSVGFDCDDIHDYLEMQLQQYWQSLENVLKLTSNDLCILLHSILFKSLSLFTVKHQCEDVEDAYTRLMTEQECIIHQIVMDRYTIIHESKQHSASLYDRSETSIENCVLEITPCQSSSDMKFVTQLFRVYKKPSKLIMFADLHMKTKQEFPFLRLVIDNLDKLCLPQKMLSILKWHLTLVTYVSYKYRKVDFKGVTVSKLIADEHDNKRREVLKLSFESFKNDWNEIRSRHWQLLKTEDTNLQVLELMQPITKMNYAAMYGENSQLQIVLNCLAKIQNNFLCLAHNLKSIKETPKTVPLLDIRSKDLLRFEWNDRFLQFSQCDSRYGLSQKIDFDYEKIEQEIQAEVLFGKCFIDVQVLSKITFTDNLFRNTVELLMELQSKMNQYPLTTDIKKEVEQKSERDASLISDLLTHTGIILSLIRKTSPQSEQPISEYLQRWETVLGISSFELKYIFPEDIKIGHIIPFYQWLEELNGENLANSLGDTYRLQLPREGQDCLLRFSKSNMKLIEKLSHAVKVFVHRCLSSSDNVIRPDQSLIDYLCDEQFWWKDDFENGSVLCEHLQISLKELLSPAIQVEHICEALQCIKESMEDSKQRDSRVLGFPIGYQTSGLNELSKRTRSKAAKKFMKT